MNPVRSHAVKPLLLAAALLLSLLSPLSAAAAEPEENAFYILADGTRLTVRPADTAAARELDALLDEEDITVAMTGNRFEQYGELGRRLSADDEPITAQPGDVLLYKGDTVCVFYGTNRYDYTRLGTVADADAAQLTELLSGDGLTITLTKRPVSENTETETAEDDGTLSSDLMARLKTLLEKILAFFRRLSGLFARPDA